VRLYCYKYTWEKAKGMTDMRKHLLEKLLIFAACFLFFFTAAAQAETAIENTPPDEWPTVELVQFPSEIDYTAPENSKDNFSANPNGFGADGMSYHDDSLDIQVHKIRAYDTTITVAFIQIADPDQFRTELAKPYPSKTTVHLEKMSERVHAVFATNADWFTYTNEGIVHRNGELLRSRAKKEKDGLVIDMNGDLHIIRPMTMDQYEALTVPIMHSFAFGPALVMDGEVLEIDRVVTYRERLGIGQIGPLCYVMAAADGADDEGSVGLTVPQLAQVMHDLGAHTAYNLDGGKSTCMLLNQVKLNGDFPESRRTVGDMIYFTTAIPDTNE